MNLAGYLIIALVVVGILAGTEQAGEHRGTAMQARVDQAQFDKINGELSDQKAAAAGLMQTAAAQVIAGEHAAAVLHQRQELLDENDSAATDRARADAGSRSLRITVPVQCPVRGPGGGDPLRPAASVPGDAGTETVELPDATRQFLLEFAHDADELSDEYRKLYRAVHPEWQEPLTAPAPADLAASQPTEGTAP